MRANLAGVMLMPTPMIMRFFIDVPSPPLCELVPIPKLLVARTYAQTLDSAVPCPAVLIMGSDAPRLIIYAANFAIHKEVCLAPSGFLNPPPGP